MISRKLPAIIRTRHLVVYIFFLMLLLLNNFSVMALDGIYKGLPIKDSLFKINATTATADTILMNSNAWNVRRLNNIITLKINEFANLVLPDSFKVTVIYEVSFKVWPSNTLQTVKDTSILTYYKTKSYTGRVAKIRPNVYYSSAKILSITSNFPPALSTFQKSLELSNEIQSARDYKYFDCDMNAVKFMYQGQQNVWGEGEIDYTWQNILEADEYDFEWTVIDNSALANYYLPNSSNFDPKKLFDNNATRVTIKQPAYRVPSLYEKNTTIFVRVRSVQILAEGKRNEAKWSSDYPYGLLQLAITGSAILEPKLNWQASTSFAEEGKRKSVVQFFDGSLRNRQTVTKVNVASNSSDTSYTVVAETFYDYEGRAQIQVLPTPTLNSAIRFTPKFNTDINGAEYEKDRYDKLLSAYCGTGADPMGTQSGASRYYSPNNERVFVQQNKYIPDANQYPFTETKYTQDESGRVSEQSGVGAYHQLGQAVASDPTSAKHQTKYYYGTADQEDLDALFGTEVGYASHYFKNMVRDANGQYSVSYVDMHGRTIATALAGIAPSSLDTISSNITRIDTTNLLGDNNQLIDKYSMQSVKTFIVTKPGIQNFNYSLMGDSISIKTCTGATICYDCLYNLEITITDDCNNMNMPGDTTYKVIKSNFNLASFLESPDTACNAVTGIVWQQGIYLDEGVYQITKKLSVSKLGMETYKSKIFLPRNTCKTLQQFIDSVRSAILSSINCETTCQQCTDSIGTWESYREKYMLKLGISAADSASYREPAYKSFITEKEACDDICESNDLAKAIEIEMLEDLHPPSGQYADDYMLPAGQAYAWSIFYKSGSNDKRRFQVPPSAYLDEDEQLSLVGGRKPEELTAEEFNENFQESWLKTLLPMHPEYPRLLRLKKFKNSFTWDEQIQQTNTYAEAKQKGYLNPTGNIATPFSIFDPTNTGNISRDPFYNICIDSFDIYNNVAIMESWILNNNNNISLWSIANILSKCKDDDLDCVNTFSSINDAFNNTLMCDADLDEAWRNFRDMYLSKKHILLYELVTSELIVPAIPNVNLPIDPNDPPLPYNVPPDSRKHILRIIVPSDNNILNQGTTQDNQDYGNDIITQQVNEACNDYVAQWLAELGTCNYTEIQKNQLVAQLVDLCKAGGDADHPMGASSVPASSTYTPKTFEDVINAFNISNSIATNINCNADLISAPLPYDEQLVLNNDDEIVTGTPDTCMCNKLNRLNGEYIINSNGATSFAAYLNEKFNISMSSADINRLMNACNPAPINSCVNLDSAVIVPPALQCKKDPCINCTTMQRYYNDFRLKYPGTIVMSGENLSETQLRINRMFVNFMNNKTGFGKTVTEYILFMQECNINYSDSLSPINCTQLKSQITSFQSQYYSDAYAPAVVLINGCDESTWTFPGVTFPLANGTIFGEMFAAGLVTMPVSREPINANAGFQFTYNRNLCNIVSGFRFESSIKAPKTTGISAGIQWDIHFGSGNVWTVKLDPEVAGTIFKPGIGTVSVPELQQDFTTTFKTLRIAYHDNWCNISINEQLVYSIMTPTNITDKNVTLSFINCRGTIDWIKFSDYINNVILDEQFNNGCSDFAKPAINFTCKPDCRAAFTQYYNTINNTNYLQAEVENLYKICGIDPDPCGKQLFTCNQLENVITGYNNSLYSKGYDEYGIDKTWYLGLNNYGPPHDPNQYKFKDFIRNGILSTPDSVTVAAGDFSYNMATPLCIDGDYTIEFKVRVKPGYLIYNPQLNFFLIGDGHELLLDLTYIGYNGFIYIAPLPLGGVHPIASMATNIENWVVMRLQVRDNIVYYYADGVLKGSFAMYRHLSPVLRMSIAGWNAAPIEVDYLKVFNAQGVNRYYEEFNDPSNFVKPPYEWICNKPDCQGGFTNYFNSNFGTTYNYNQITSLFEAICEKPLNLCPLSPEPMLCAERDTFPEYNPPTKCDLAINGGTDLGTLLYQNYQDSLSNAFEDAYLKKCLDIINRESFTVSGPASEYHYTLYYYDQAGNLVKTIPPEGVNLTKMAAKFNWSTQVRAAATAGNILTVQHRMATHYRYNTLNQVQLQYSPDADTSKFWYDKLGRLVISQNAKQKAASATETNRKYSYTLYDGLGRITEVGEYTNSTAAAMSQNISRVPTSLSSWLGTNGNKKEVTQTVYDLANSNWSGLSMADIPVMGRNLRNRVSYTQYYSNPTGGPNGLNYNQASFYSYDIHGNVDTLIQDYGNSLQTNVANMMNNNKGLHNRFKRIVYQYDLVSGKVNHVAYQPQYIRNNILYRPADAFYHRYEYDAENRITAVFTSTDSIIWENDATYKYYKHGPLARTELGEQRVQGIDYVYTLQGWLKAVNSSSLAAANDIGQDGLISNNTNKWVGRDALAFSLNYFNGDYSSIFAGAGTLSMPLHTQAQGISNGLASTAYKPLYNGNINSMVVNTDKLSVPDASGSGSTAGAILYNYRYDQLNRIVAMDAYKGLTAANNSWANMISLNAYKERIAYDANGNILKYLRHGNVNSSIKMDSLGYKYNYSSGNLVNNRLIWVKDSVLNTGAYADDIENQANNNYTYDAIGNLTSDIKENISSINWNAYGKIGDINFNFVSANKPKKVTYNYDASGNRIGKRVESYGTSSGDATSSKYTWYVRDASGNVMATYSGSGTTALPTALTVDERHLYGSSRLGLLNLVTDCKILPSSTVGKVYSTNFIRGNKFFELTNHLGNVLVTISDKKIGHDGGNGTIDYYTADVVTATDYYPGGMGMPGRKYKAPSLVSYRYGFNGKENDNEVKGEGNQQDYGMRIYDPRLVRFLSRDPLSSSYPYYSPYQFAGNTPIQAIDLDGEEPIGYSTSARFKHPGKEWIRATDDAKVGSNVHGQWFRMQIKDAVGAQWTVFRRETQEIASYGNYHRLETKVDFYYLDNSINAPTPGNNYVTNPDGTFAGNLINFDARERTDMKQNSAIADGFQYMALGIVAAPLALEAAPALLSFSVPATKAEFAIAGAKALTGGLSDIMAQATTGDGKPMNWYSVGANTAGGLFGFNSFTTAGLASTMEYDNTRESFRLSTGRNFLTNTLINGSVNALTGRINMPWNKRFQFNTTRDKVAGTAISTIPQYWLGTAENLTTDAINKDEKKN